MCFPLFLCRILPKFQSDVLALDTIIDTLEMGYPRLEPESFLTSAELTTARRTDESLRGYLFYTANFGVYDKEKDQVILYFGGRPANPILGNLREACRQLQKEGNYKLSATERGAVLDSIRSGHTLRVLLSELRLQVYNDEFCYFEIDTASKIEDEKNNYDLLNPVQRVLAEAVFDYGDDFVANMKMFREAGIKKVRISVLNPDYVKEEVTKDPENRALGRGSWLDNFSGGSDFGASDRSVSNHNALRGVLQEKAQSATPEEAAEKIVAAVNVPPETSYSTKKEVPAPPKPQPPRPYRCIELDDPPKTEQRDYLIPDLGKRKIELD